MDDLDEKKIKRAAANVNERRRMQNINTGFEALREFIDVPNKLKLSKSAILRHSVDMLRNLMSDNQQLREQNLFLRNLYNGPHGLSNNIFVPHQPPPVLRSIQTESILFNDNDDNPNISIPKKTRIENISESDNSPISNEISKTDFHFCPAFSTSSPFKSPKKYSAHVNKLLASPKRMTRSSVIRQTYSYASEQNTLLESPTRRSLRLQEKHPVFMTPPSSGESNFNLSIDADESYSNVFKSPNARSIRVMEQKIREQIGIYTPESAKNIPARSAKRSLDAIIEAIDQLEKA